jgi:hypothetical protein
MESDFLIYSLTSSHGTQIKERSFDLIFLATSPIDGSGEAKKTMSTILEATFKVKRGAPWKSFDPPIIVTCPFSSPEESEEGWYNFLSSLGLKTFILNEENGLAPHSHSRDANT